MPKPEPPKFRGTISPLPPSLVAKMRGTTWRPGCPVPLPDLRLLTLRYWDFHHRVRTGPLVINASQAHPVLTVFRKLFKARFPIAELHLTEEYIPSKSNPFDRRDWSGGFNCRVAVTALGPRTNWSQHAYGLAIDVNPMQNPYVTAGGFIYNVHARRYRDRSQHLEGMIHPGDVAGRAPGPPAEPVRVLGPRLAPVATASVLRPMPRSETSTPAAEARPAAVEPVDGERPAARRPSTLSLLQRLSDPDPLRRTAALWL